MIEFKIKLFEDDPLGEERVEFAVGRLSVRPRAISHVWEDDDGIVLIVVDGATFQVHGQSYDQVLAVLYLQAPFA